MIRIFREPLAGAKRQKVVSDITREHPAEMYKVSRDVIFTLQKRLFNYDSNEWLQVVIAAIIQSGTTEECSAFVI